MSGPGVKGLDAVLKNIVAYGEAAIKAQGTALFQEAEVIKGKAKDKANIPYKWGNLRDSGHVTLPKLAGSRMFVTLGFGGPAAPYALRQHEEHKTKSKYLERPFDEAQAGMDKRLAERMQKTLDKWKAKR